MIIHVNLKKIKFICIIFLINVYTRPLVSSVRAWVTVLTCVWFVFQESPSEDHDGHDGIHLAPHVNEKKISVKEKTQIFNKMASETTLIDRIQKNTGKNNRASRAEKVISLLYFSIL